MECGLPAEVRFCARRRVSNQRPSGVVEFRQPTEDCRATIGFDAEWVCSACRYTERRAGIECSAREEESD